MKLEDIKKMNDEEFIVFARSFNASEDIPIEEFFKQNKKTVNIMTIMPGITFGLIPYSILDNFTDDRFLSSIYGGTFVGVGLALVFKGNSSTGGSDLIAQLAQEYNIEATASIRMPSA